MSNSLKHISFVIDQELDVVVLVSKSHLVELLELLFEDRSFNWLLHGLDGLGYELDWLLSGLLDNGLRTIDNRSNMSDNWARWGRCGSNGLSDGLGSNHRARS